MNNLILLLIAKIGIGIWLGHKLHFYIMQGKLGIYVKDKYIILAESRNSFLNLCFIIFILFCI